MLDAAGFKDAVIVASNDLNEHLIASLKQQGAAISVWGVGTMLVTAYDQPTLGGVYKLSAIRQPEGTWEHKVKLSEHAAKATNPGILQVRRFSQRGQFIGDAIYDVTRAIPGRFMIVDPTDVTRRKRFPAAAHHEDLLVPVLRGGKLVYKPPILESIRSRAQAQLASLHPSIKRLENPHEYPAGLELSLHEHKLQLILRAKGEIQA
jgi:nicotinate phosphoribosyltransferase